MNGEILYQGHASLRITTKNGDVIYIDPYAGKGYDKPADLILVTHQHFDHTGTAKVPKKNKTVIWQNFDALKNGKYQTLNVNGIKVRAVEAYNINHPKDECVGYILEFDGIKVYVAGDTALTEQMKHLKDENIDFVFLPIDGIYTMSPEEAAKCADIIEAKQAIPYHSNPMRDFDSRKANKFNPANKRILKAGETIAY